MEKFEELKPCPFCGGNQLVAYVSEPATPSGVQKEYEADIHCLGCKTRFMWKVIGSMDTTREDVRAHAWSNWGRRAAYGA